MCRVCIGLAGLLGLTVLIGIGYYGAWLKYGPSPPQAEELRWENKALLPTKEPIFNLILNQDPAAIAPAPYHPKWVDPTVAVYTAPSIKILPGPVSVRDLSDNGQAHLIDVLAKPSGSPVPAWPQLAKALAGIGDGDQRRDPYRLDRVLVATVTKGLDALPGDRFLWTRVFVEPINFEFAGYTIAAADNRTVKLADIETDRTRKLELGAGAGAIASELSDAKATASNESSQKSKAEVSQQYEGLGVDIQPNFLRIMRESAAGVDVAGNVAISLSMVTDPSMIWKTDQGKEPKDQPGEELALSISDWQLDEKKNPAFTIHPQDVLPHCALTARVWMLYEVRKIQKDGEHYLEGLQDVALRESGELIHDVELVRADDVSPDVWSIKIVPVDANVSDSDSRMKTAVIKNAEDLRARADGSKIDRKLVSSDYSTMSDLVHWLKEHPKPDQLWFRV